MTARRLRISRSRAEEPLTDGGSETAGTLVGIATRDGVLLAADTRTSQGTVVRSERVQKLAQVHPTAAMGSTDHLGVMQSFVRTIRLEADRYETDRGDPMTLPELSTVAAEKLREESESGTFVLGGVDADGSHVFCLRPDGGVLEDEFVAVGSGQAVATGVLEAEATDSLPMAEARRVAGRALASSAERDALTGVGVRIAEITAAGVETADYESVDELL
ncbi:proteasome beta subunit [Natrinema hispanicum]|uniref:proteasome endopeptidase complex n=1 Tax=Natrinema hispanicum TaxID=392421 RepID=A0A482YCM6_9EURY|nr:proteasome subunit beta [Natrinema hispanicum]RZV10640.1 proteasome beta subunit [Natrinema hispanicum]